ncbi:MAG: helix-turn-helix transcriptional regulator [Lachnospiraceae bacterium]|nr:helix-turn-helix transcriptional regulator [Lachnospiraceae bacterium]
MKDLSYTDYLTGIGKRLARARENAGYPQEALVEKTGCSAITISRWENGHTAMKAVDTIKVTQALGISADYLLGTIKPEAQDAEILGSLSQKEKTLLQIY